MHTLRQHRAWPAALVAWLGIMLCAGPVSSSNDLPPLLLQAKAEFEAYQFQSSLGVVKQFLAQEPGADASVRLEAYSIKVRCEMELGRKADAQESFCTILGIDPGWKPDATIYTPEERGVFESARSRCVQSGSGRKPPVDRTTIGVTGQIPRRLTFLVQPTSVVQGKRMAPPIEVAVQNESGVTVPADTFSITLKLSGRSLVAGLGGVCTRPPVSGVARFDDIVVNKTGVGLSLVAEAPGLAPAISSLFSVIPGKGKDRQSDSQVTSGKKKAWYQKPGIVAPMVGAVGVVVAIAVKPPKPPHRSELQGFPNPP